MAKPEASERRAVLDRMRSQQRRAERRRTWTIIGACVLVALLIVGAAAFSPLKNWWDLRAYESVPLTELGAPAADACGKVTTKPAEGSQDHVPDGTDIAYSDAPPAFGQHYDRWEGMERKLYTEADRPPLGRLVHNLEHGFTILWYDETIAEDDEQMDLVRAIAAKQEGTDNLRLKFIAAPWTSDDLDGKDFPDGQHIAFTHWSVGGVGAEATNKQVGAWQYCSEVSGEALERFMLDYPYMDSPEPLAR